MTEPRFLPMLGQQPPERRDAAHNRKLLLEAAQRLVEQCGPDAVTMEAVATEAGVGKGTVFRRFTSRSGLMAALLNHSEAEWQANVMGGPAPLGPGAPPIDRLLAFGRSRMITNLRHADLIRAAGHSGGRPYAAYSFAATHVRYLLGELHVRGDIALLATSLLAPLELVILEQQTRIEGMSLNRVAAGWEDLVHRVIAG
ncbi:TetR/AcrR family transcriptional regulator [Nocardioides sp.]|uniref:TetR/AcrR family transcriptional regulator n=1 Tax=Nocardioides sp. TaxID=35761 RepID=UPI003D0E5A65